MKVLNYAGWICIHKNGEGDEVLYLSNLELPLSDELNPLIHRKQVSVRYWICDKEVSKEKASYDFLKTLFGDARADYGVAYSETTGYLWTDDILNVGGHDLISEFSSNKGRYLILEITVHAEVNC